MLLEKEVDLHDNKYMIKQLPLPDAQEVLLRLFKLVGEGITEANLGAMFASMTMKDVNFLREKLLGRNCAFQNDQGHWVPMSREIVDNHFAGHPGRLFHLLGQCLLHNYSDFLADLDLGALGLPAPEVE